MPTPQQMHRIVIYILLMTVLKKLLPNLYFDLFNSLVLNSIYLLALYSIRWAKDIATQCYGTWSM